MRLEVRESFAAKQDRQDIWLYIANDSVRAADDIIDSIIAVSQRAGDYPESGQPRPELGDGIRSIPLGNYVIYYRLLPRAVFVLRILHAARNAKEALKNL
ncbi:MAG: type II toxin-antitoxin system RelE/ParE family toxin [Candidatus Devosia phytovorans]|uniref:Type II toxin-antitoxin system RelE/ParE family toxin n=1 Tax=Candidatus Devosia phytovorans TaxID=3121372 RepID=A0AAJ5VVC1_9HYPH|nr:type II toxin-antitoxin system RelE/ParE family toxin [Devosia sp.]WEK04771.1 MAG: type II toxin-antitoxin system RelE/ParE family toxin [Devosia sp.]